jgi:hypothetical protein
LLGGLGSTLHGELAGFLVDGGDRLDLWPIERATEGALYARQEVILVSIGRCSMQLECRLETLVYCILVAIKNLGLLRRIVVAVRCLCVLSDFLLLLDLILLLRIALFMIFFVSLLLNLILLLHPMAGLVVLGLALLDLLLIGGLLLGTLD